MLLLLWSHLLFRNKSFLKNPVNLTLQVTFIEQKQHWTTEPVSMTFQKSNIAFPAVKHLTDKHGSDGKPKLSQKAEWPWRNPANTNCSSKVLLGVSFFNQVTFRKPNDTLLLILPKWRLFSKTRNQLYLKDSPYGQNNFNSLGETQVTMRLFLLRVGSRLSNAKLSSPESCKKSHL